MSERQREGPVAFASGSSEHGIRRLRKRRLPFNNQTQKTVWRGAKLLIIVTSRDWLWEKTGIGMCTF